MRVYNVPMDIKQIALTNLSMTALEVTHDALTDALCSNLLTADEACGALEAQIAIKQEIISRAPQDNSPEAIKARIASLDAFLADI